MNLNKIVVLMTLILKSLFIYGQQTPVYSEYAHNAILINPAHAGFNKGSDITISNRSFVNGFDGLPTTTSLTLNSSTKNRNIGFGISAINDRIGISRTTGLTASFGYKLIFDYHPKRAYWWGYNPNTLTFGISAGALWVNEDIASLNIQNDIVFAENINAVVPSLGVGVLYNRNQFYVGLSNTNLLSSITSQNQNFDLDSPNYLYGGYKLYTSRFQKVQIKPNFLLKYTNDAPYQADLNVSINYKNITEFGIGYRTNSSVNILALLHKVNKFKILFSYNFPLESNPIGSTLGLLLKYKFNGK